MKNLKIALISLLVVVLLTGCGGKKTLNCNGELEGMKTNFTANFDSKSKFESADLTMEFKVTDEMLSLLSLKEIKETFETSMKESFKNGAKVTVTDDGKDKLTIKVSLDKSGIKSLVGEEVKDTYNDVKKSLEDDKFTCK